MTQHSCWKASLQPDLTAQHYLHALIAPVRCLLLVPPGAATCSGLLHSCCMHG